MDTDAITTDPAVLLTVRGVTKDFPGLRALDDVSISVSSGEIVALLGQNGSGKSTLVKVLAGVYTADSGEVIIHGGRHGAAAHDTLHFIHQDLGLVESLSTVENLALRRTQGAALAPLQRKAERRRARELIGRFGIEIDVQRPIAQLTPAQRTIVAIARAMDGWTSSNNVLVLDEPTAALHGEEVQELFTAVRLVAAGGAGVLFISHRLEEVTELADRVIVLRDGRVTAEAAADGLTATRLAALITGRSATSGGAAAAARTAGSGPPALGVAGLAGGTLQSFDLELWPGEVVGITGSLGSGREHVAGLIYGAERRAGGTVAVGGVELTKSTPQESLRHGMALVPADRRAHGGVMTLSMRENLTLPDLGPVCLGRVHVRPKLERATVYQWIKRVNVQPLLPERPLGLFSGGNQQKAVIARWLRLSPKVLLIEEPTQGVDVGSSEAIRALIVDAAGQGMAVLVVSSDNTDLTRTCSRVLVLRDGRCVAVLEGAAINDHRLTQECLGSTAGRPTESSTTLEEAHA